MSQSIETEERQYNILNALQKLPVQLYDPVKITDTLQGSLWRASTTSGGAESNAETVVIKATSVHQHNKSISIVNNTVHHNIKEDIISEQNILKYLTQKPNCSSYITKFISFFQTDDWFVFVQEDGGHPLFNFVQNAHMLLKANKIDIEHWKDVVQIIFKQMIQCLAFLHSNNVCHNDISLENWVINDAKINVYSTGKVQFALNDIRIKLCDFGLAHLYSNSSCLSSDYCGKRQYQSPEIVESKRQFDAKKNDVWCIGVCLFMLSFGSPPWHVAQAQDALFCIVMNGQVVDLLHAWKLSTYINPHALDLLQSIFKYEEDRISIREMERHPFMQC
eukprot:278604_1